MKPWELVDFMSPLSDDEEPARTIIGSEEQLREELGRLRGRKPAMVALMSPQGERLDLGIGGAWSGVQWTKPPYSKNLRMAVATGLRPATCGALSTAPTSRTAPPSVTGRPRAGFSTATVAAASRT